MIGEIVMNININKKIKELRHSKNVTQETLATYLGVTPQAISRWESGNGYPDIETLPLLADFFSISTDELLGFNLNEREKRVEEIKKEIIKLSEIGNDNDNLNFARQSVAEFPSNLYFQKNLADCICRYYMWQDLDRDIAKLNEAEKLYITIINDTQNDELKFDSIAALASLYGNGYNDSKKALLTVNNLPRMVCSRENIRADIFRGEESILYKQKHIELLTDLLGTEIQSLVLNGMSNETEKWDLKINMLRTQINLYEMIFGDDLKFYNERLSTTYRIIATYLIAQGKQAETLDALEKAAEYAIAYDKAFNNEHGTFYSSPFVNNVSYDERNDEFHELTEHSQSYYMLERLTQNRYDTIRSDKRFIEIIETLTPYCR